MVRVRAAKYSRSVIHFDDPQTQTVYKSNYRPCWSLAVVGHYGRWSQWWLGVGVGLKRGASRVAGRLKCLVKRVTLILTLTF